MSVTPPSCRFCDNDISTALCTCGAARDCSAACVQCSHSVHEGYCGTTCCQWALEEIERLGDALVVLLHAVEDYGLDAAFGDEKFKAVVTAREAVRRAT